MIANIRRGAVRATAGLLAACFLASIACSSGEKHLQGEEPSALATNGVSNGQLVTAGLWAGVGSAPVGLSMRVEPGDDLDNEPWYFYLGWSEIECQPQVNATEWHFSGCDIYDDQVTDFEATVPKRLNPPIEVAYTLEGGRSRAATFQYIAERQEPISEGVDLLWHHQSLDQCDSNTGIWAEGGLVFAPCTDGIVEILDAASGKLKGVATLAGARGRETSAVMEVTSRGGRLYAATTGNGVAVWDVTDGTNPRLIGQFIEENGRSSPASVTNVHTLTLSPKGDLVFAVNQSHPRSDVRIIDVSDPANPREAGKYLPRNTGSLAGGAHDLALEERDGHLYAYLNQLGGGFHILDVTDPVNIMEVGEATWPNIFSHSAWQYRVGNKTYVAHTDEGYDRGLTILDVTDVAQPQIISRYQTRPGISIHNIRVVQGIAYISYYLDGLRVVDIRDPQHPKEVAHFDTVAAEDEYDLFDGAWGVHVDNGVVYISDRSSGVYAFRVRLP